MLLMVKELVPAAGMRQAVHKRMIKVFVDVESFG